jgi:2-oxoglutarate ferredoxin oxidoreductase subunit delta
MTGVHEARGSVTIAVDVCKGCELCIDACPPHVLTMSTEVNRLGYRYPELHDGCTGCAACQLICPDFVFDVFRRPRTPTAGTTAGSTT